MTDYSELKLLAEKSLAYDAKPDSEKPIYPIGWKESFVDGPYASFQEACTPSVVLALISENELRIKTEQERDLFRAEIDEDKLHFSAMGKTVEDLVAERNQLKAELLEESMMSECMRQFRADMIKLGVVGESCPPMMMTEGVLGYIEKLKAECEGLRKDAEFPSGKGAGNAKQS